MFQRILATILFTSITIFVICESKCEEYILIMKQNTCHGNTLTPSKLKDLHLDRFDDCSTDATDKLSYKDLIANKSCIIELKYSDFEPNCTSTLSKDQSEDINLIYVNGNNTMTDLSDISNSSGQVFNVMQCLYTDNICLYDKDLNNTKNSIETRPGSTNTIIALVGKEKTIKPAGKVIDHTYNDTDFNCTKNINATEFTNHDHFKALSLDVIQKYSCRNKSFSDLISNTSLLSTHTVNVYFETDFTNYNNQSMDYVFCSNNFDLVNKQTQSIHCEVIENETSSTTLKTEVTTTTSTKLSIAKELITTPTLDVTTQTENLTPTDNDIELLGTDFSGSRSSDIKEQEPTTIEATPSTTEEKTEHTTSEYKSTLSTTKKETEHTTMKTGKPVDVTEVPRNITTNGPNVTVTTTHLSNVTTDFRSDKEYRNKDTIDVYTLGPWAILTLVFSIIGAVSVVILYAGYIFRPRKKSYRPAPTRDWANMDDTAF